MCCTQASPVSCTPRGIRWHRHQRCCFDAGTSDGMVDSVIETLNTAKGYGRDDRLTVHLCTCIATLRLRTERELLGIKGIGPHKLEQYGAELPALVRETEG